MSTVQFKLAVSLFFCVDQLFLLQVEYRGSLIFAILFSLFIPLALLILPYIFNSFSVKYMHIFNHYIFLLIKPLMISCLFYSF